MGRMNGGRARNEGLQRGYLSRAPLVVRAGVYSIIAAVALCEKKRIVQVGEISNRGDGMCCYYV